MSLDHPVFLWLLVLVPVEFLVSLIRRRRIEASVRVLSLPRERARALNAHQGARLIALVASSLFIAAASLALAGPSWGLRSERVERSGLEVAVLLDVSRSMEARDASVVSASSGTGPSGNGSRLEAAKALLRVILGKRAGDSFSLTVAKGEGLLLVPMTEDLEAVDAALEWSDPSTMTRPGTDLGSGLATALGSFSSLAGPGRLMLLLSDGGDLGRSARAAALEVRSRGVKILTVGFGGPEPVEIPGPGGAKTLGPDGAAIRVALEPALLRDLAAVSGGRYFEAGDGATLPAIGAELDDAGGTGTRVVFHVREEAPLFVFLALAFLIVRAMAAFFASGLWRLFHGARPPVAVVPRVDR